MFSKSFIKPTFPPCFSLGFNVLLYKTLIIIPMAHLYNAVA